MLGATSAFVAATVETVRVDFVVPGVSEVGLSAHVGGTAVAGVTAHVKSTVAERPALGVMVTVAVADPPAEMVGVESVPVVGSVKSAPVPARLMVWGLPAASSMIIRTAVRAPAADGVTV